MSSITQTAEITSSFSFFLGFFSFFSSFLSSHIFSISSTFSSYFSGFSFLSNSNNSSIDIFNFFVLFDLLAQYFHNQSRGCPEILKPSISFSQASFSSKVKSETCFNFNLSSSISTHIISKSQI